MEVVETTRVRRKPQPPNRAFRHTAAADRHRISGRAGKRSGAASSSPMAGTPGRECRSPGRQRLSRRSPATPRSSRRSSTRCGATRSSSSSPACSSSKAARPRSFEKRRWPPGSARKTALLCQSGYTANLGLLQVIADPQTPVYLDSLAHMSLVGGRCAPPARRPMHSATTIPSILTSMARAPRPGPRRRRLGLQHHRRAVPAGRDRGGGASSTTA